MGKEICNVTLNLFQGPWSTAATMVPWMLKQVQHDGLLSGFMPGARS